jgi:hypothetical protein
MISERPENLCDVNFVKPALVAMTAKKEVAARNPKTAHGIPRGKPSVYIASMPNGKAVVTTATVPATSPVVLFNPKFLFSLIVGTLSTSRS